MNEEAGSDHPDQAHTCVWCGEQLRPEECARGRVCEKCYHLLKDAGRTDEEVFGPPEEC